jgi:hypothetical protein
MRTVRFEFVRVGGTAVRCFEIEKDAEGKRTGIAYSRGAWTDVTLDNAIGFKFPKTFAATLDSLVDDPKAFRDCVIAEAARLFESKHIFQLMMELSAALRSAYADGKDDMRREFRELLGGL